MFAIFRSFLVSEDLVFLQQQRALVPALYTHLQTRQLTSTPARQPETILEESPHVLLRATGV